jgi:intracellular sulfur oxidation DsrE/DsrF family protein
MSRNSSIFSPAAILSLQLLSRDPSVSKFHMKNLYLHWFIVLVLFGLAGHFVAEESEPTANPNSLFTCYGSCRACTMITTGPKAARLAIVFHGPAVDGILDETHYKAKFGINNPNLKAITEMKKQRVEFFVCGQYLAAEKIDPKSLTPDVALVADALLVLMQYQNKGYALMSF